MDLRRVQIPRMRRCFDLNQPYEGIVIREW